VSAPASNVAKIKAMLIAMAAETAEFKAAARGAIADVAAGWLAPQYLLALREQLAALPDGLERFKLLRLAAGDVVALQRGDHWAARLQLDREKLALELKKHADAMAQAHATEKVVDEADLTENEVRQRIKEIYGR